MFIFLIAAAPTGLRLAALTPIGQVADEPAHIARAAGLLHGQILGHRTIFTDPTTGASFTVSGVLVNEAIIRASLAELVQSPPQPLTPERRQAAQSIPWTNRLGFDISSNTAEYFPAFYVAGAAGIALGRALGGTPLQALYAGRVGMVASYLLMGAAALALAKRGRALLFVVLLLPMTISLGASFNQDGQLIAAAALAAALLTRNAAEHPGVRACALILLVLVTCSKPPYGLLLLASAVPLAVPGAWRRLGQALLAGVAPAAWSAVMVRVSLVPFPRPAYHPGPLWPGSRAVVMHASDAAGNLAVLLARPAEIVLLPAQFLFHNWPTEIRTAIGVLGWLTVPLPFWQYLGWTIAFLAALPAAVLHGPVNGNQETDRWRLADGVFLFALVIGSAWAMELALYLSWTEVGAAAIEGPIGRYYLPLIPFLTLGLAAVWATRAARRKRPALTGIVEFLLLLPAVCMALINVFFLPRLIGGVFNTL